MSITNRAAAIDERLDAIAGAIEALTASGEALSAEDLASIATFDEEVKTLEAEKVQLATAANRIEAAKNLTVAGLKSVASAVHMSNESEDDRKYREWGPMFLRSVAAKDPSATAWIHEYNAEQVSALAATSSTDVAGVVVPEYRPAQDEAGVEGGRRFLRTIRSQPLRSEVVHVPVLSLDDDPDFQSAQNVAGNGIDASAPDASYNARTILSYVDISKQGLDWGSITTADVLRLIDRRLNRKIESEVLSGTADAATSLLGIANTPNIGSVSASGVTTVDALWKKFGEAFGDIDDALETDGDAPVLVVPRSTYNQILWARDDKSSVVGIASSVTSFNGFTVVASNNIYTQEATPQAQALIVVPEYVHFYEAPRASVVDTVTLANQHTVRLTVSKYVAFPGVRPNPDAAVKITNLGTVG